MPQTEVRFLVDTLFAGADGRAAAARIDERVARLPGLGGLRLVSGAVDRYGPATERSARPADAAAGPVSGGRRAA
jgi:hypothetical protein